MTLGDLVAIDDEVARALGEGRAVVALESSIIAQGFPRPDNLALALEMVTAVRDCGAVPAVTAVVDGSIRVGADDHLLRRLAVEDCLKCGARDLAVARRRGELGATTVSATARIAATVGIRVFATGGIGGVHRRLPGDAAPFDVSADLAELARSPVAVVSSGAKSILDLPATLEALEAFGVPVLGYRCEEFPAFFSTTSGLPVSHSVDDIEQLASILADHWGLAGQGALICAPPPAEFAIAANDVEAWVQKALVRASEAGVAGAAVTPFLLAELRSLSGGRTLTVNRALALNNARLGAQIAVAMTKVD